jgi:hypothetical protein
MWFSLSAAQGYQNGIKNRDVIAPHASLRLYQSRRGSSDRRSLLAWSRLAVSDLLDCAAALVFNMMKPQGTSPFKLSLMPSMAHSATSLCEPSTSSMPPVESRWPATLIMSKQCLRCSRKNANG